MQFLAEQFSYRGAQKSTSISVWLCVKYCDHTHTTGAWGRASGKSVPSQHIKSEQKYGILLKRSRLLEDTFGSFCELHALFCLTLEGMDGLVQRDCQEKSIVYYRKAFLQWIQKLAGCGRGPPRRQMDATNAG